MNTLEKVLIVLFALAAITSLGIVLWSLTKNPCQEDADYWNQRCTGKAHCTYTYNASLPVGPIPGGPDSACAFHCIDNTGVEISKNQCISPNAT